MSYDLWAHYKQGDDLAACIEQASGDVSAGLRMWAAQLEEGAANARKIAAEIENVPVRVVADSFLIEFHPETPQAEAVLDELVVNGVLEMFSEMSLLDEYGEPVA